MNIVVEEWIKVFNLIHFMTEYSKPGMDIGLVKSDLHFSGYQLAKF